MIQLTPDDLLHKWVLNYIHWIWEMWVAFLWNNVRMNPLGCLQILDPLTALLHVVQVMNLLKMLIIRKLRDRHEEVALLIKEDHQHRPGTALAETTNSQADEHDEPDSIDSSGSVLHTGHQKQYGCTTSAPPQCTADTKVVYEENSHHHHHHHITIPPNLKCSTTAKPNSGKLVNTISTGVWSFCCWVSRHLFLACKALLWSFHFAD